MNDTERRRHIIHCLQERLPWQRHIYAVFLSGDDIAFIEYALHKLELQEDDRDKADREKL